MRYVLTDDYLKRMDDSLDEYQKLELSLIKLTDHTLEELVDLFAKGYTLTPPTYTLLSMADLAEEGE